MSLEVTWNFPNFGTLEIIYFTVPLLQITEWIIPQWLDNILVGQYKHAPIAWKPNKLNRVIKSILSAETLQTSEPNFMTKSLLCELLNKEMKLDLFPIYYYTSNKSLVDTINSTKKPIEKFCGVTAAHNKVIVWQKLALQVKNRSVFWKGQKGEGKRN